MKKYLLIVLAFVSFCASAQNLNIYSKWVAYPNEKTQLILDISGHGYIAVKRILIYDHVNYRIDSFGNKRKYFAVFTDVDSSSVSWFGQMVPLHDDIPEEISGSQLLITKKDRNNIPIAMKLIGEVPELELTSPIGDTLEFIRIKTEISEEVSTQYQTFYGGSIEHTIYYGENTGESGRMENIGMQYTKVRLNSRLKRIMNQKMMMAINKLREKHKVETLVHYKYLDLVSNTNIKEWSSEMNTFHHTNIYRTDNGKKIRIDSTVDMGEYSFLQYPYQYDRNLMLVISNSKFHYSRGKCLQNIKENQDDLIEKATAVMMNHEGTKQNILNNGYTTTGFDIQLIKGSYDDFYFDENGKKIIIKRKKDPYYYFILAQTFSMNKTEK